jgi:hypothetical protein
VNLKGEFKMKTVIYPLLLAAVLGGTAQANGASNNHNHDKHRSRTLVVESPSVLPELAQKDGEALYLHSTSDGRMILYIEGIGGKNLSILDVTDPAKIRPIGRVDISGTGPFDFVQDVNGSAILIRYRNEFSFATLNVHKIARPVITPLPAVEFSHNTEVIDNTGLLASATDTESQPVVAPRDYEVVETTDPSHPVLVDTVSSVKQTLSNKYTGTQFLLSHEGVTVVRRPQIEQEYATGQMMMSGN